MVDPIADEALLALIIIGFLISFLLAFSMGANDVANAFGTSYGSRVLNFVQVCILASIFETLGSVLLGARVSDTISRGIANMELYERNVYELMYGYLSSLVGASGWLLVATVFKLPVSGTHSIVGSVIGFTIVAHGPSGVKWMTLVKVVVSWFSSPLLSGAISSLIYLGVKFFVLKKADPLAAGGVLLPILYGLTFAVISFMVINESVSHGDAREDLPIWGVILVAIGLGVVAWFITFFALMPWFRKKVIWKVENDKRKSEAEAARRRSSAEPPKCVNSPTVQNAIKRVESSAIFKKVVSLNDVTEAQSQNNRNKKKKAKKNNNKKGDERRPSTTETTAAVMVPTIFAIREFNQRLRWFSLESDSSDNESVASASTIETTFSVFPLSPTPPSTPGSSRAIVSARPGDAEAAATNQGLERRQSTAEEEDDKAETPEIRHLFSFIQVVTATFASFSHGANDVSNAVGPLIGMFQISETGDMVKGQKPQWWLLLFGGLSMSVGLWILGKRVMLTIGDDLTTISPATGFSMELGTAITVLIASHLGVPISTTHCLVGSVICVSLVRSRKGVDWRIARNIGLSWIVTVPAAAFISAACMAALDAIFDSLGTFNNALLLTSNSTLLNATLTNTSTISSLLNDQPL